MSAEELSALRSDIAALRSVVKLLDFLAEDYRPWTHISDNLESASTHAACALAALVNHLSEEPKNGGVKFRFKARLESDHIIKKGCSK